MTSNEVTSTPAAPATVKPGWRTTEFYLSAAAALLGILYASGIVTTGGAIDKIAGLAATLLAALGYTVARGRVKSAATMLIVVILAGAATQPACATARKAPAAAGHAIVACAKADALPIAVLIATWGIESALAGRINWDSIEAGALAHGVTIGGCAADRFVAAVTPRTSASVLPVADPGAAVLERLRARWGGVEWRDAVVR